ncbi:MAG TPA: hypothetical protein VKE41_10560 [Roseiflexaceae bacterium]|nr:hypothetical protein [Roseiflexaceae bacterium]
MYAILILIAALATAYLVSHMTHREAFQLADLLLGVVGGLVGLAVAQYLSLGDSGWNLGLPLLVACGLTLGLSSIRSART